MELTFIFNHSCLNFGVLLAVETSGLSKKYLSGALTWTSYFLQKGTQNFANLEAS